MPETDRVCRPPWMIIPASACVLAGPMGDHLALLVDRLLTESTLEAAIGSRKQQEAEDTPAAIVYCCDIAAAGGDPSKMVECRICQEEDWDSGMEAPCACRGSLKVTKHKHVQNV